MSEPIPNEVTLSKCVMALLRAMEDADPSQWTVHPANWGDGRTTYEIEERTPEGRTHLGCQFRPTDFDGTEADAQACIDAARDGARLARSILRSQASASMDEREEP